MISSKPPTSPGTSVYMYNTGSANSTFMSAKDLHKERVAASTGPRSASKSPKGTLRVKETKVIREVRQEDGKPPEISEKKEETVKEEKVNLSERLRARSRASSPATPTLKRTFNQTDESNIVTLSAVKETHQTLEMTPIKVNSETVPSTSYGQRAFPESVQLDMLIDKKRLVLNVNFMLLAEKHPEVEILGFTFKGQKLWEKSSEWNLTSANTTSHTKTIARQASNILGDEEKKDEEQK